ncbi:hypothetical protein EPA93_14365 [Ktedonosporobacter rubrisoli]|uniref:Uncharacterized protein n=1 Tax=Ktedonosporobacter rubrisoli TaxID=2509675 RepID=A0A4P6JP35_KTERU|nr:hypothetical protein [Ktedonosporobacter rubrisoli]QBD77119.1 hypothetical protein EPA93_14365 [Ktedonosporobacter rubrisoli]
MLDNESQREEDTPTIWVDCYIASRLAFKRETTQRTYALILRQFLTWLLCQPGHQPPFDPPTDFTQTAVQTYLFGELADTSISHRECVKSILNGFVEWLIDEEWLTRNSTRGIEFPAQQLLAPRELSIDGQWEHIADITFHDLRHGFGHGLPRLAEVYALRALVSVRQGTIPEAARAARGTGSPLSRTILLAGGLPDRTGHRSALAGTFSSRLSDNASRPFHI